MEIHVIENAVNSLEVGLDFYNKFLDNIDNLDISVSHFGNLKFTVVAIQNAVELLSKSILLDVNELIVFNLDIENDPVVCNMLRDQFYKKHKKANIAYNAVFSRNDYKTIEYSKCISLIMKIFNNKINQKNYNTLSLLGEYRNTLTHLGYASTFEWYKILIVLNETLKLILKFYIENINNFDRYFSNETIELIKVTLEKSDKILPDLWVASNDPILEDINSKLDNYFSNGINIDEIKQDKVYGFYESIIFKYKEDVNLKWIFKYSYLNEAIIITDENNRIVCFISLDDENLKYKKDDNNIPTELEKMDIYIPKKLLKYGQDIKYDIKSRNFASKIECEENANVGTLINMYLKNCS
ncbi:hypothetical protein D9O40_14265 [Clostridium autoethanogenum]|uniref:Uncharacterized protein n=1 Tax=Clostridium autoethanogenum TaxID=84023 RepID=A0A3M0SIL0_9CLOT|nr:hypothetical protein [Clostridium autoethanogenum]RMC97791.1 hypothetical protein D9O40_14265 [Clostridium autoethanogenum]